MVVGGGSGAKFSINYNSLFVILLLLLPALFFVCEGKSFLNSDEDFFNERDEAMDTIVNIVVGVIMFFFVAVVAFCICLCCPICLLARMRGRRRGVVYRSAVEAPNGATVTTQQGRHGTTIVVTNARAQTHTATANSSVPPLIAIPNPQGGKPYPVQESVTVVPLAMQQQPQQPYHHYQHQQQYPVTSSPPSNNYDPPPPYPGLPDREGAGNLPYNPYFSEDAAAGGSAPPLPSKQ